MNNTIKQLKDKYAIENGYENWQDYLSFCKSNGFDESEALKDSPSFRFQIIKQIWNEPLNY
jgi:hypothetical protein